MNGFSCYKMSGSGNDFVFVDGRRFPVDGWEGSQIRDLCRRGTGIGADGFVVLEPGSAPGRVRFHFFNSDGERGPMCGNGALCATRMVDILEMAPPGSSILLETDSGTFAARTVPGAPSRATIEFPDVVGLREVPIERDSGERSAHYSVVAGVPHLVVLVDDASAVPIPERGSALRNHVLLAPGGANANFVSSGPGGWAMRTFERGVECETLACGTGAVACAAVLAVAGQIDLPWSVRSASGSDLTIAAKVDMDGQGLVKPSLTGEARLVFRAEVPGSEAPMTA